MSAPRSAGIAVLFGICFAVAAMLLLSLITAKPRATGYAGSTGDVQLNVAAELGVEVVAGYDALNIGTLSRMQTRNTLPFGVNPRWPFKIRNSGNVDADVTVCAVQNLWTGTAPPGYYQFQIAEADTRPITNDDCVPNKCFNTPNSQARSAPMPIGGCPAGGAFAIDDLHWQDATDEALLHFHLTAPADEPAGTKSSTVIVTGLAANTYLFPEPMPCSGPGQRMVADPAFCFGGTFTIISTGFCCTVP